MTIPFLNLFTASASKYSVPLALVLAVADQESGFNPNAQSPAGANGLMQVVGGSFDPATNIDQGVSYLAQQIAAFETYQLALAAYNAGPGAVKQYGGIPPYPETQRYVPAVMALYQQFLNDPSINATSPPSQPSSNPTSPNLGTGLSQASPWLFAFIIAIAIAEA